jgi:hypothetical protein
MQSKDSVIGDRMLFEHVVLGGDRAMNWAGEGWMKITAYWLFVNLHYPVSHVLVSSPCDSEKSREMQAQNWSLLDVGKIVGAWRHAHYLSWQNHHAESWTT